MDYGSDEHLRFEMLNFFDADVLERAAVIREKRPPAFASTRQDGADDDG